MLPIQVLSHYPIGTPIRIKRISNGFVHTSYKVVTVKGVFLLQKLHPKLGTPGYTSSYRAVSLAIHKSGMTTQEVLKDTKGRTHIPDGNTSWRVVTFVPGRVITGVPNRAQAKTLAYALGKVHRALRAFPALNCSPMKMHQTKIVLRDLNATLDKYARSPLIGEVKTQTAFILNTLPALLLPSTLPQHTIHGDTKINNFVLLKTGEATMIDLDTCTHGSPLLDIGEMFGGDALSGSWCRTPADPSQFNLQIFKAGLQGYQNATGKFLTRKEVRMIVQAVKLIVLELAARFLIDYFKDSYFGWDSTRYESRRAHNLTRVNSQITFYNTIVSLEPSLQKIVQSVFK